MKTKTTQRLAKSVLIGIPILICLILCSIHPDGFFSAVLGLMMVVVSIGLLLVGIWLICWLCKKAGWDESEKVNHHDSEFKGLF